MTLIAFYLAMIVYLTDGTPLPQFFVIPVEQGCNAEVAAVYARQFVAPALPEGYQMQEPDTARETLKYACFPIEMGTPGPAMGPEKFPGDRGA